MTINDFLGLVSGILAIAGAVGTALFYYRSTVEKRYAAERDFAHIRRNIETVGQAIAQLDDTMQERFDKLDGSVAETRHDLKEIKAFSLSLSQRFEMILTRLEANSSLFNRRTD